MIVILFSDSYSKRSLIYSLMFPHFPANGDVFGPIIINIVGFSIGVNEIYSFTFAVHKVFDIVPNEHPAIVTILPTSASSTISRVKPAHF